MSEPLTGEIRMFGGNYAPVNWALCNGALMAISQNSTLFQLIGTTYGGDGVNTFALPNLQARVPIHQGQGLGLSSYVIGQAAGVEAVTLTQNQIPSHNHSVGASGATGDQTGPSGNFLAGGASISRYAKGTPAVVMSDASIGGSGGNQPHTNVQPFLTVNFIICLFGIFPSRN